MKIKILFAMIFIIPMCANAAIPYRVEQIKMPVQEGNETYASEHRFYVGGMYNLSLWQDFTDKNNVSTNGKSTQSYELIAGVRATDTFRIEFNYMNTQAEWNNMSFDGETFMLNAIIDARIDDTYRIIRNQMIMPYVGVGVGASWNFGKNTTILENKVSAVVAALAGISIEFNPMFALDFGYRYFFMTNQKNNIFKDWYPSSHQFRAGARISF